jgi:LysM repeat protein
VLALVTSLSPRYSLAQEATPCQEEYIVQQGDWLSKIAEKYLGDVLAYDLIVQASNSQSGDAYPNIADPDLIEPGWTLGIPEDVSGSTDTEGNRMPSEEAASAELRSKHWLKRCSSRSSML